MASTKTNVAKKNSDTLFRCAVVAPKSQVYIKCEILKVDPNISILFRHKKPKSSKYVRRTVAWKNVLAYSGDKGSKEGFICYESSNVPIYKDLVKFSASVDIDEKTGMFVISTADNQTIYARADCVDAVAEEDGVATPKESKPKKK